MKSSTPTSSTTLFIDVEEAEGGLGGEDGEELEVTGTRKNDSSVMVRDSIAGVCDR
jgi:hypothetical protein